MVERLSALTYRYERDMCTYLHLHFPCWVLYTKRFEMLKTVFLACADDAIGRFEGSMLLQQVLMEFFVFWLDTAEDISGSRYNPREVCTWQGVECNAVGEVVIFEWAFKMEHEAGTVVLKFLPCSMTELDMSFNALSGTIQLADLPEKMGNLNLSKNRLSGSLRLDDLPVPMKRVFLGQHTFSGEISLERLPKVLRVLNLSMNTHQGTICLTSLPPVLETMYLNENMFDADPIDGHRKVVGQDQYPALGEVRETAKLLPRGESPWWRDEGRHLLILCCFQSAG